MRTKKQSILIISLFVILIIGFYYLNYNNLSKSSIIEKTENKREEPQIVVKPLSENNISKNISESKTIKVSLVVLDKKYETNAEEGESVFDAMKKIEIDNQKEFSFKFKNYSSLGSFVEEINGEKGTPGKYWIYYVNDKKASVGVSKYILKEGDIINWRREGV